MAVTLVTTIKRYEGTAAEMAAMDVAKVPAGSTFFQNDTGLIFNLSAGGTWTEKKTNGTVQLYGSKVCLSSEAKPAGEQGDTLLEYDEITGETKVYKYISGDWREL